MDAQTRRQQDEDALARFKSGDPSAFTDIVEAHKDSVHQFVLACLGRTGEAEDLAQEVFLQAYQALPSFRGESRLSTWLYSLARHVCLHHLRAKRAEKRTAVEVELPDWLDLPDGQPGAESLLQDEETRACVRQAVDSLPPPLRAVIVLSHWEDLPYAEISRILDIPVGTVKSRAHNAAALLAGRLKPLWERPQGDKP